MSDFSFGSRAAGRERADALVSEGNRYGLAPDVSREIAERVCQEATDQYGRFDENRARARFHEIAARAVRLGGRLRRDPGKGAALGDAPSDGDAFGDVAPGRGMTLVEQEQRRLTNLRRGPGPGNDAGLPGLDVVNAIRSGGLRDAPKPSGLSSDGGVSGAARDGASGEASRSTPARGAAEMGGGTGDVGASVAEPIPAAAPASAPLFDDSAQWEDLSGEPASQQNQIDDQSQPLPYQADMERAFDQPLGHVRARTGQAAQLAPLGAQALTVGNEVMFADAQPSAALVAHETTHAIQNERAGASAAMASGVVAPRESAAEAEADANASRVGEEGSSAKLPPVTAAPAAHVQLSAAPGAPVVRLNKSADAAELQRHIMARAEDNVLKVLERNAHPEHMYALHQAYGSRFIVDLRDVFRVPRDPVGPSAAPSAGAAQMQQPNASPGWLRARVYLGDQLPLDQQIATRLTRDEIFRDLERVPDRRVLELLAGEQTPIAFKPDPAATHHAPAPTSIEQVQHVLRDRLDAEGYYAAMQLLLSKADRALAAVRREGAPAGAFNLGGIVLRLEDLGDIRPVWLDLDPVAKARVDLAEQRIRAADAAGDWSQHRGPEGNAWLAIADLSRDERRALALRLRDRPLVNASGASLAEHASVADDATVIKAAIDNARTIASVSQQAQSGVGLQTVIGRVGELIRAARRKVAQLPADAAPGERATAEAEVARLTEMFLAADSSVLAAIRSADPGAFLDNLQTIGADPVTIGSERLKQVARNDVPALVEALQQIAPPHRLEAMERSGKRDEMDPNHPQFWTLTLDERALIGAYLQQGWTLSLSPDTDPATTPSTGNTAQFPAGMSPTFGNADVEIALHDVITGMDQGPSAAHSVLARLDRMKPEDRNQLVTNPRFLTRLDQLPTDTDEKFNFKYALRIAATDSPAAAIAQYPKSKDPDSPGHQVQLEELRAIAEHEGRGNLRRGYVLLEQLKRDTGLTDLWQLDAAIDPRKYPRPGDYPALRQVILLQQKLEQQQLSAATRAQADDILYGGPQLLDSADGAVDPNLEADFMYGRLGDLIGDKKHKLQEVDTPSGRVAEALAAFGTLYDRVRQGGISRSELAELAVEYHRATREFDQYKKLKAENEELAKLAALVAGVVTALVVTIVTGGALGPPAMAALAAISSGTAAAVAGAEVRWEDSTGSVLKDFGTGAVEGAASVAGSALAARVVRAASTGLAAGRAAAHVGGTAVARATGGAGAKIAEGAIDGAFGGMAGDLFQTAVDEATWDRGVAEAMAKLLTAAAKGAALGAGMGAAMGVAGALVGGLAKLAARAGREIADNVAHLLDASGLERTIIDPISDAAREQLGHATQLLQAGKVDEAEQLVRRIHELPPAAREILAATARARGALTRPGALGPIDLAGESIWPKVVSDAEFFKRTGDRRAHAMIEFHDGKPQILARMSASPSAIREELIHLEQFHSDALMRRRMEGIANTDWGAASAEQKLQLHVDKLEVEADAQRILRDQLSAQAEDDPDAALRLLDAEETLFKISQRLDKLNAARGLPTIDLKALGIEHAPQLFARGAQSKRTPGWLAAQVYQELVGKDPNDAAIVRRLKRLGYETPAVNQETGKVYRINRRDRFMNELPHISVNEDTGLIELAKPRKNFGELKDDAAQEWRTEQPGLKALKKQLDAGQLTGDAARVAHAQIAESGMGFRKLLEEQVVLGHLDEGSAGLLARWAPTIELLESQTRHLDPALRITAADVFTHLPTVSGGKLRKVDDDAFRHYLRDRTADYLVSIKDPVERQNALYKLIDAQPENSSGGHLFTAFRQRLMASNEYAGTYSVHGKKPASFEGSDLTKTRQPDDVVDIKHGVEDVLPGGRYAIEDKTGSSAFQIDQAEDYARRADASLARRADGDHDYGAASGGFKLTKDGTLSEYDGLVYVFSRMEEAEAALLKMGDNKLINRLLGKHPGGIHVMAINMNGELKMATPLPSLSPKRTK